ncbi:MAG: putative Ig domain-containing protein, partial [Bdellovibrionales bacterium]|nr:putative Ig domain-containing protein [Bdellovibrionales bacterium]
EGFMRILLLFFIFGASCQLADNRIRGRIASDSIGELPAGAPPSALTFSVTEAWYPKNVGMVLASPAVVGDEIEFSVSPALPSGLSVDSHTGVISGNPGEISEVQAYTLTASNAFGSASVDFDLGIAQNFVLDTVNDTDDLSTADGECLDGLGDCSLRAAFQQASAEPNIFSFIHAPSNTYVLSSGVITATTSFELKGDGVGSTILDGNSTDRILYYSDMGRHGTLKIKDIEFRNGRSTDSGRGGAIFIVGLPNTLQLQSCRFFNNQLTNSGAKGGAINAQASHVFVDGCAFESNVADGGAGAIYLNLGANNSSSILNSEFINNSATGFYGGALIYELGSMGENIIRGTSFVGNSAYYAGAIYSGFSSVTIEDSYFSENESTFNSTGAAIRYYFTSAMPKDFYIINSTFDAHTSGGTSVIDVFSPTQHSSLGLNLQHVTFKSSTTAAISATSADVKGFGVIMNTLTGCQLTTSAFVSQGYNMEVGGNTCGLSGTGDLANAVSAGFSTGTADFNGGPTKNLMLDAGSAAKDVIPQGSCIVTEDQRGQPRPANGYCDMGSIEVQ